MDPIGTKDDPNLYMYVAQDPVNNTDPTGKQTAIERRSYAVPALEVIRTCVISIYR